MFQHTAARRRLHAWGDCYRCHHLLFQHTAARRRLPERAGYDKVILDVSTHSRPKAAAISSAVFSLKGNVSTHSRPKAAASGSVKSIRTS